MSKLGKDGSWRDSVLRPKGIKFSLRANREDDTINLVIPLQKLVELQAHQSFAAGVGQALVFFAEAAKIGKQIDEDMLKAQMMAWGLDDVLAKALKAKP